MNRLNWIQQEQKTADYHVLTWRTSHFHHPRNRTEIVGQIRGGFETGGGAPSSEQQQPEGIGFGLSDPARAIKWTTGGLGMEGMAEDGRKDALRQEAVDAASRTSGRRINGASQSDAAEQILAAAQAVVPEEVYSVLASARRSVLQVKERVKQGTGKLREHYQTQQKKAAQTAVIRGAQPKQPPKEQHGTRRCDKEDVLSMQAQNHYLLDSYDKNGNYSMLGK